MAAYGCTNHEALWQFFSFFVIVFFLNKFSQLYKNPSASFQIVTSQNVRTTIELLSLILQQGLFAIILLNRFKQTQEERMSKEQTDC